MHLIRLLKSVGTTGAVAFVLVASASLAFARQTRAPEKLVAPAPVVALKPAKLENLAESKCVTCHATVAAEWAGTAHAIAWVDEEYVASLADKKRPETCYGCHAPKPLLAGDLAAKPAARDDARGLGITCESCHVGPEGKVLGPRGTKTSAHASEASDVFSTGRSNALCISCHRFNVGPVVGIAKDFEQSKLADKGFSCVGCHLADVETKFAARNGDEDPPSRKGKSHAIQTPRDPVFLAQAFELALETKDGAGAIVVKNRTGHRVPGLIGRSIEFEVKALDAEGREIATKSLKLDATAYLPVQGELSIALGVPAKSARVVGKHTDPRAESSVPFLDVQLVLSH